MNFMTFHSVGNVTIPTDEFIFFRWVGIPPTSIYIYLIIGAPMLTPIFCLGLGVPLQFLGTEFSLTKLRISAMQWGLTL
jgi:hypothetical protein